MFMIEIAALVVSIVNLFILLAVFNEVMDIRDYLYFKELFNEGDLQDNK